MAERIKVLIVDDNDDTRDGTRRLLEYEDNIEIVGFAENGQVAVEQARDQKPNVILMDINMPVMDGLAATEVIKRELPRTQIIVVSVQDDAHYMRQAFQRGAFDFVAKPITSAELALAIERAWNEYKKTPETPTAGAASAPDAFAPVRGGPQMPGPGGRPPITGSVISIMSLKGGTGKTTLAVNLGVALARSNPDKKVLIVDGNVLFGDVGVFLNTRGQGTVLHAVQMAGDPEGIDSQSLDSVLVPHESGVKLLLAPPPGESDAVGTDPMVALLAQLKTEFHYIILDTATTFDNVSAAAIHSADRIIVLTTPTMPALKDARILFNELHGADIQKDQILLVLNEVDKNNRITAEQIGNFLKHEVAAQIPDDPMAVEALNQGTPLVSLDPKKAVAARPLMALAQAVKDSIEKVGAEDVVPQPQRRGLFGR